MRKAEAAGENETKSNTRGNAQFCIEDKEEKERWKSELNCSKSEASKSASLKGKHAHDTYSVISSSSSSSQSS
ncbi:uncharacterized protein MONOS_13872 [Monocercomonoides exilis]|uniref:uncharacterized protein n=1 Tax=Monocercomonoides exilis TaxID=2049356 RepID=UPI00355A8039|nr:hypothetical protein MONOS_13872 [Monocercomonoides exilis]|eukprot:MONOS_13872.1-p1 / transcript=MONOS_13872.1 / gene=MONOS_13872 / organism=Monocercomonoides_exilis_PA203 / gene_product=unspecified product / transcript_product=unspecified product / location=Mono_scaffold00897:7288-7506(+) / protein_length=73 / sequence_SO=supercontig / SO=protein_coding / is_pseudo=false